ncbi:hypothetical protein SYNTR_0446 [Candidatus Syntrophocurvum alkaliphilum]|uniref:Alkaline phosphatase n=1 Tax=Candidatus Syntrophocurvum alkaliphilum TaxID=2293317 RepID=A0A6I6DHD7_9FIRM|nr:hypothetical protein [Candidatus Syntrophocurvum alkaliphilum]QGT99039.1 hypothetical protein SYNTR_0446 [Candidatus Syntrophocurvum alkaliphilum]
MKKIFFSFLVICFVFFLPSYVNAETIFNNDDNKYNNQVVVFLIDKFDLEDLNYQTTPNLYNLSQNSSLGLLNTKTASDRTVKNICATISASGLAVASTFAHLNFESTEIYNGEKAGNLFFRNTGIRPDDQNLVVSSIEVINRNNHTRNLSMPGYLGDSIQARDFTTAVVGNSDLPGYSSRNGVLILMSSMGIVDDGAISKKILQKNNLFKTNQNYLVNAVKSNIENNVLLIELGDLSRLDTVAHMFSNEEYNILRLKLLSHIDSIIGEIKEQYLNDKTDIYVISTSTSRNTQLNGSILTPIIVNKSNFTGVLGSYSTQRDGIVLATNIANSIINSLDANIKDPLLYKPTEQTLDKIFTIKNQVEFNYNNQRQALLFWGFIILICLIILTINLVIKRFKASYINFLICFILSTPLTFLILTKLPPIKMLIFLILIFILNLTITLFFIFIQKITNIKSFILILGLTILIIIIDLIFALDLINNSLLSYQVISGFRYYGIGNEYLGFLLGSTIVLCSLLLNRKYLNKYTKTFIALLILLVIGSIAYPFWGINVGGTITATLALAFYFLRITNKKINLLKIFLLFLFTGSIVAIIALIDLSQPTMLQSHLANSINAIKLNGVNELLKIINSKLSMHIDIINYSKLGWLFLGVLAFTVYIFKNQPQTLLNIKKTSPFIYKGLEGIILASVLAVIFNDSGIITASIMFIYFYLLFIKWFHCNKT